MFSLILGTKESEPHLWEVNGEEMKALAEELIQIKEQGAAAVLATVIEAG